MMEVVLLSLFSGEEDKTKRSCVAYPKLWLLSGRTGIQSQAVWLTRLYQGQQMMARVPNLAQITYFCYNLQAKNGFYISKRLYCFPMAAVTDLPQT